MTKDTGKWLDDAGPRTRAIRSGISRIPEGGHVETIFTSSSFLFDSSEDATAKFAGEVDGNVCSRYTNPTVRAFEERLAALEQGDSAVATASGMSAILALCPDPPQGWRSCAVFTRCLWRHAGPVPEYARENLALR